MLGNPIDVDKLRDTYVNLLLERGANDEALAVRWELFDKHPTQTHYGALRRTSDRTGDWTDLREKALGRLRSAVAEQPAFADHLIGVFLEEGEQDEAWQVTVDHADAVHESRWHQLIDLRQPVRSADVIAPWQRLIEQRLGMSNDKYRYGRAIKMLGRLRDAHHAGGDVAGFHAYVDDLRHRHERKTSFIAKLDRAKLSGMTHG